jgi:putative transposase
MPATHLSLHCHVVFSTKDRVPIIDQRWRKRLHSYLGGTACYQNAIPEAIGGTADHVHLLIGLLATHQLSEVVRQIKHASSRWIHETIGVKDFLWQSGYGAFTVNSYDIEIVKNYISRQEEHHRRKLFKQEYMEMLEKYRVEYDERFLW